MSDFTCDSSIICYSRSLTSSFHDQVFGCSRSFLLLDSVTGTGSRYKTIYRSHTLAGPDIYEYPLPVVLSGSGSNLVPWSMSDPKIAKLMYLF